MKIFVAIPTYDGKVGIETIRCLLNEQTAAAMVGDELTVTFLPGCSLIPMGRNQLAKEFMSSDCERMVFIDADVSWEPGALIKIAHSKEDFVGGAYRFKKPDEAYPVGWLGDGDLWSNENGLLKVHTLPTGFLSLSRAVFDKLKTAFPDRGYQHHGHLFHCFFYVPHAFNGVQQGEDCTLCIDWIAIGGEVFLDPEIPLTHWDNSRPYPGHIGNWLKNRSAK